MRKLFGIFPTKNPDYFQLGLGSCVDPQTKIIYRTVDGKAEYMLVSAAEAEIMGPLVGSIVKIG